MKNKTPFSRASLILIALVAPVLSLHGSDLQISVHDTLESHGLSVFLFHSTYHSVFGDQKMSGLEIVFHDQRIATNGDVRLSPTPAPWDPIPQFKARTRGPLLVATNGGERYRKRLQELAPVIGERFANVGWIAVRAIPLMDTSYQEAMATSFRAYRTKIDESLAKNPYGVPIPLGTTRCAVWTMC